MDPRKDSGTLKPPRLHVVTDDAVLARPDFVARALGVLESGQQGMALHVRGPRSPGRALFDIVGPLAAMAGKTGSLIVVNDRLDVAMAAGLRAVHLGRRSLPVPIARSLLGPKGAVGLSVHSGEEMTGELASMVTWAFAGTVFDTPSHPERKGAGVEIVSRVVAAAGAVPVLAIGGVTEGRVADVMAVGAHGVAVVTGVWGSADPAAAVRRYLVALATVVGEERGEG